MKSALVAGWGGGIEDATPAFIVNRRKDDAVEIFLVNQLLMNCRPSLTAPPRNQRVSLVSVNLARRHRV